MTTVDAVVTIQGGRLDARYTLLDKLGAGGQGEVWGAHDEVRGVDIALKILNPAAGRAAAAWAALEREYEIASRLDHPAILKIFAPERSGDFMMLPMELASGGDLRRLRGAGYLEIIPVLLEIAQALEHAHARGVVHRDLKPGNVLFDSRGRVRLADFGVAETAEAWTQSNDPRRSAGGHIDRHGLSPFTASPGQLRGEAPTPADDVYGLGALAYELLSGYPPYYPHFDRQRAIDDKPVPALVPTRQIPPLLNALIARMLAKDAAERPRTMREVIDELDAALNDTLTFDFETVTELPMTPLKDASGRPPTPFSTISPRALTGADRRTMPDRRTRPRLDSGAARVSEDAPRADSGASRADSAAPYARTSFLPSAPMFSGPTPQSTTARSAASRAIESNATVDLSTLTDDSAISHAASLRADLEGIDFDPAPVVAKSASGPSVTETIARTTEKTGTGKSSTEKPGQSNGQDSMRAVREHRIDAARDATAGANGSRASRSNFAQQETAPAARAETAPAARAETNASSPDIPASPVAPAAVIAAHRARVDWPHIPLEEMPRLSRLEPIRPRRWPWIMLGLCAGAAAGLYFWLPHFDPRALPSEVRSLAPAGPNATPPVVARHHLRPDEPAVDQGARTPPPAASTAAGQSDYPQSNASVANSSVANSSVVDKTRVADSAASPVPTSAASEAARTVDSAPAHAADSDADERLRVMRHNFDNRITNLEARGAGAWAGRDFAMAKSRAAESIGARDAGNSTLALDRLTSATQLLNAVERRAPQALTTQISTGEKALRSGQQEVASQAFDLAHRIDPADPRASEGQRRTRNLNGVLPLLADAQNAESAHDYARAAQDYSQALSLDPGNPQALEGQTRANAAFGNDNYARAVGSGFAALGAGRLEEARDAFTNARSLKPRGAEASQGLARVNAALTARGFAALRQRAAGLEAQERWDEAQQIYDSVLKTDPSIAFAQQGKTRAAFRAQLSARLQGLIDRPERLAAPGVRDQVRGLLETAQAQSPSGPVLRSQTAQLQILLPGFDKPVRLSVLSDNSTQVAIPSIGSFGTFSRRDIVLRPGRYTVVGTRNGFREVRREITVAPGQEIQTIRVSCSDPI